jgi:hypothetical protein
MTDHQPANGVDADREARAPAEIRAAIEQTREQLGEYAFRGPQASNPRRVPGSRAFAGVPEVSLVIRSPITNMGERC